MLHVKQLRRRMADQRNFDGASYTTAGRRVTEAETAGAKRAKAKANRRDKDETPRASTDTEAGTRTTTQQLQPLQRQLQRRQVRERV